LTANAKSKRLTIFIALTLILLAAGGMGWIWKRIHLIKNVANTLPVELRAARQEGLALRAADLVRVPPVPEARNAARLYRQIFMALDASPFSEADKNSLTAVARGRATGADRQRVRALLAKFAPQLRLAEQAAALPDCSFERQWQLGYDMKWPEYAKARNLARLLAAQAELQSEAGHPEQALCAVAVGAHIGRHIGQDPIIIAMLVQIAIESILHRPFVNVVKAYADRPDVLQMAAQTDQAFGEAPDLRHALRGEVVCSCIVMDTMRAQLNLASARSRGASVARTVASVERTAVDAQEACSLAYWRRVYARLKQAQGDLKAEYQVMKEEGEAEETREDRGDKTHQLISMIAPTFGDTTRKVLHNEAERRLRRTLLALLASRQRAGQFPPSLSALTPPAPPDVFTGRPLLYRPTQKGFLLYSVGENFKDDGGQAEPKHKGDRATDIVIAYP
jgi:hypothetical protein